MFDFFWKPVYILSCLSTDVKVKKHVFLISKCKTCYIKTACITTNKKITFR